jgi:hypothetical protein
MDQEDLAAHLQEMTDNLLIYHGFTPYMRDYELIVLQPASPASGMDTRFLMFLFRSCTEVLVRSLIGPQTWSKSMNDELLRPQQVAAGTSGYVWGVRGQELYPGPKIVENSRMARSWSQRVGTEFHEVEVKANAQQINLVFTNLSVEEVSPGYTPFTVGSSVTEEYATGITMYPLPGQGKEKPQNP